MGQPVLASFSVLRLNMEIVPLEIVQRGQAWLIASDQERKAVRISRLQSPIPLLADPRRRLKAGRSGGPLRS